MGLDTSQFSWKDITAAIGGKILDGITEVSYSKKATKELLYGRGNKPHKVLTGNFEFEGKITIWQSELIAMEKSAPDGEILNLEFDITIAYIPKDSTDQVIKTLKGVQITDVTEAMAQGDTHMKVELPIIFTDIKIHQ